jgi:hypothetical protein
MSVQARYTCGNVLPAVTRYSVSDPLTFDATDFTWDSTLIRFDQSNEPALTRFTCGNVAPAASRYACVP